ncbi:hypothetical protein KYG_20305 [Acidovorax sp. NO-1]|nr:hypothetical protein KYG_20305 [Acidovorax sp. NO-1]
MQKALTAIKLGAFIHTDTASADGGTVLHAPKRPRPSHPIRRELGAKRSEYPFG